MNGIMDVTGRAEILPGLSVERQEKLPAERVSENPREVRPSMDRYIPEEKAPDTTGSGIYQVTQDEDGQRRIIFDAPADEEPEPEADELPKSGGKDKSEKTESCTGNTDKVDREIEKLKKKKEELEQKIRRASEDERAELERQLAQVEDELRRKDNDTYRRQHSVFT